MGTKIEAFAEDQIVLDLGFNIVLGVSASTTRRKNDQSVGSTPDYDFDYDRVLTKV